MDRSVVPTLRWEIQSSRQDAPLRACTHRLLFANHEDVKPLELKDVPLSASIAEVKALLRAAWPAGSLPTGMADTPATSTAAGAASEQQQRRPKRRGASASRPSPSAAALEPEPPQTPLSVASTVSPVVGTAAATAIAATDDELEEEELEEEEEESMRTPPSHDDARIVSAPRVAVEAGRIRLICLGRGWDDDGKTLKGASEGVTHDGHLNKTVHCIYYYCCRSHPNPSPRLHTPPHWTDYNVQVFEDHPTPVQVAIRPGDALGPAASGKAGHPPKALEGDDGEEAGGVGGRRAQQGEEGDEMLGPLMACCGCGIM